MRNAFRTICVLLSCVTMTASCGQKGPLFLPGDAGSMQTTIPAQSKPEQEDDDFDNEDDQQ